jgi:hypothetical protein
MKNWLASGSKMGPRSAIVCELYRRYYLFVLVGHVLSIPQCGKTWPASLLFFFTRHKLPTNWPFLS